MVAEHTSPARADARTGTGPRTASRTPHQGFRPDVEGLRAVAVGLVLLYHGGLSWVPGGFVGVDIFFVISGFLITGLLLKEVDKNRTVSLVGFYARRAKRLLPAAALVLTVTAALSMLVLPRARWTDVGVDIGAAATYVVNWRLAANETNYLAEDTAVSPVQHYWSLAVEEQFYFVWPLLVLAAVFVARKTGIGLGKTLLGGLALIAMPSLLWSLHHTRIEPESAFFVTTTRMWELAIGAFVAIVAARLARMPRPLAIALGWGGLVALLAGVFVYDNSTPWPGYAAALPTLGTAAVIAAGHAAGPNGPVALLGTRPFTWVGGLSYSLYLWHWPLIVIASVALGGLSTLEGVTIAVLSVVPAYLTLRLVENPVRFSPTYMVRSWATLRMGAVLTVCGLLAGAALGGATLLAKDDGEGSDAGAAVLGDDPDRHVPEAVPDGIEPDPLDAEEDVPSAYDHNCQAQPPDTEPVSCSYGDPDGDVEIAVVGDSKALQWISALDAIGKQRGWQVHTYTKSSCPFVPATVSQGGAPYNECTEWGERTEQELLEVQPDAVITSQIHNAALTDADDAGSGESRQTMISGLQERWKTLTEADIDVTVLRDNPNPNGDVRPVFECVDENRDNVTPCVFDRAEAEKTSGATAQLAAAEGMDDVSVVDLNDYICPDDECPPVIGDVLVYRQGAHLTDTYVRSLQPQLDEELTDVIDT